MDYVQEARGGAGSRLRRLPGDGVDLQAAADLRLAHPAEPGTQFNRHYEFWAQHWVQNWAMLWGQLQYYRT